MTVSWEEKWYIIQNSKSDLPLVHMTILVLILGPRIFSLGSKNSCIFPSCMQKKKCNYIRYVPLFLKKKNLWYSNLISFFISRKFNKFQGDEENLIHFFLKFGFVFSVKKNPNKKIAFFHMDLPIIYVLEANHS